MLFEAGLLNFLRTLLIFVGVYYAFRLIFRMLIPFLLKRMAKKYQGNNTTNTQRKTGDVHINRDSNKKKSSDNLGEYVDYEEVKEKD